MKKLFVLAYAVICYGIGLMIVAYYADFFIGYFVPKSINEGKTGSIITALGINFLLMVFFTLPHTVMARRRVKEWMRKSVPLPMERSTYVLVSSILLFILCVFWQPLPAAVYDFRGTFAAPLFMSLYGLGWFIGLFSTFLIDHFDLFGLKQAWSFARNKRSFVHKFVTPLLYRLVRHPIYLGWLLIHWCTPYLSVGQLFLAIFITIYIIIAIKYEERDLLDNFGEKYRHYQRTTPKLIPIRVLKAHPDKNEDFLLF
jgi:protein-S-isoprenylcysteine O-methyltransferase Ste14